MAEPEIAILPFKKRLKNFTSAFGTKSWWYSARAPEPPKSVSHFEKPVTRCQGLSRGMTRSCALYNSILYKFTCMYIFVQIYTYKQYTYIFSLLKQKMCILDIEKWWSQDHQLMEVGRGWKASLPYMPAMEMETFKKWRMALTSTDVQDPIQTFGTQGLRDPTRTHFYTVSF